MLEYKIEVSDCAFDCQFDVDEGQPVLMSAKLESIDDMELWGRLPKRISDELEKEALVLYTKDLEEAATERAICAAEDRADELDEVFWRKAP